MACDAEQWQEVDGVAGVAAPRSGDVMAAVETAEVHRDLTRLPGAISPAGRSRLDAPPGPDTDLCPLGGGCVGS
jgi:hypothetical protein